ncbi:MULTISPECIES: hypothetical protein [unclassified Mesorhizobium]|uniref:hypothetical protein n=1 Tax=unclassified Mesorhizobium TaxID=325217 RepID=UPI000BB0424F|nr:MULTISPECIES: hypothetical protein [unclassified Mesorhizobium]PBB23284.1 hypothetical protein CK232_28675 [Mesorhizobium sp. WSM4304]PBB71854.1 hypothetical protein CK227_29955 [Mesorhizobium sp. WSM4308]
MTEDQRAILDQHGVTSPVDLPLMERLRFANAPSEAEVVAASKAEARSTPADNVPADAGRFAIDGPMLWEAIRDPRTRAEINDKFELLASERVARNVGRGSMSDDAYFREIAAMRPYVTHYTAQTITRMLIAAGRAAG